MASTVTVKRKRGRPRRDEQPEINDFDISLIREFSRRPAFYDRSCVHYRNRDYLDVQWEEMAHNLGYDVALIKDRIIQLRNRYNLEKRRVESLQDQYNDPDITSQWPMFEYMNFLGDHIKTRRPYTNNSKSSTKHHGNHSSSSSEDEEYEESHNYTSNDTEEQPNLNGKSKNSNNNNNNNNINPPENANIRNENESIKSSRRIQAMRQKQAEINSLNMQQPRPKIRQQQLQQQSAPYRVKNLQHLQMGAEKFKAFGQFLSASLIEMNEGDALRLVDKFTSELVRSLRTDLISNKKSRQGTDSETNVDVSI